MVVHQRRKYFFQVIQIPTIFVLWELSLVFFSTVKAENEFAVGFTSGEHILKKCCGESQYLGEDGTCLELDFETRLNLEKVIFEAIEVIGIANTTGNKGQEKHENVQSFSFLSIHEPLRCGFGSLHQRTFSIQSIQLYFTSNLQFFANFSKDSLLLDSRDYCVDWASVDKITVRFCVDESCQGLLYKDSSSSIPQSTQKFSNDDGESRSLCIRKCCSANMKINMTSFSCMHDRIPWELRPLRKVSTIEKNYLKNRSLLELESNYQHINDDHENRNGNPLQVTWLTGTPNCVQTYEVYLDEYDRYYINTEGVLITELNGTIAKTPPGEYCFEAVVPNDVYSEEKTFSRLETKTAADLKQFETSDLSIFSRQMAIVCFDESSEGDYSVRKAARRADDDYNWMRVLYTVLTGISCAFLLITCIVYIILWKDLNLPGWLQFAYALALLLTFILLIVAQIWTQRIHDISKNLCRALGYGLHFFFLSCFFWLTSMNLDLWLSFRSTNTALIRGFGKSRGKRRFLEFTAFSIGFPAVITMLVLAVDSCTPDKKGLCALPTTGIGEDSCAINRRRKVAQLQYFYSFVGLLLLLNLVIFVCTLISLRNRERETRMAKRQSTSAADYDRLQLFTRLFLIMGILWIFEVISWLFGFFDVDESIQKVFIFTDCLNASQGIAVFVMFVWKKQTWKQLKKKFKSLFRKNRTIAGPSTINGTSVMSSHLSSTKSTDSSRLMSTATGATALDNDHQRF